MVQSFEQYDIVEWRGQEYVFAFEREDYKIPSICCIEREDGWARDQNIPHSYRHLRHDNYWNVQKDQLTLIRKSSTSKQSSFMTNLISTFKGLFVSEPQKTFQKAGITDQNGTLTADGQTVFMSYLLEKNGDDFKTAVVDRIVEAQEAEKK